MTPLPPDLDRLLRLHRPMLREDILRLHETHDSPQLHQVEVLPARDGSLSLRIDTRWIHSTFRPAEEAARQVARLTPSPDAPYEGTLVIGVGLGYTLDATTNAPEGCAPSPRIGVVEDLQVVEALLTHRDHSWWITHSPDRLVPAWFPHAVSDVLRQEGVRTFQTILSPAIAAVYRDQIDPLLVHLRRQRERHTINRNTLRRFGKLWVRNTLKNAVHCAHLPGIEEVTDCAAGGTAVVCGAGPSLDAQIENLARIAPSVLIVAVDTALKPLQRAGIEPDAALIADPQYWNTRHLDNYRYPHGVLIAESATHPRVFRLWQGPQRVSASLFPLGGYFDRAAGRTERLGAGGSVATSAWDLSRLMGCTRIGLIGIDLGFPSFHTHCRDSFFEQRLTHTADRTTPAEMGLWRYLSDGNPEWVERADGERLLSDQRMRVYRSWFAEQTLRHQTVTTTLLSPQSSAIEGVPFTPLPQWHEEAIASGCETITRRARKALRAPHAARKRDDTAFSVLYSALISLRDVARRGREVCRQRDRSDATTLDKLDLIDREIFTLAERDILGVIAGDQIERAASRHPSDMSGAIAQADELYTALETATEFHLSLLQRYNLLERSSS